MKMEDKRKEGEGRKVKERRKMMGRRGAKEGK